MSEAENHHHGKNEIIIVKKHRGDHDGAHGGAWKIAYADFMTAMMAFFLVMWLVNAANEETKASMASYFNPIKLSDETPAEKGIEKPVDQAEGQEQTERSKVKAEGSTIGSAAATGEDMTSTSGDETHYSEADYFENPYSVLAEIAQEVGQQANISAKGEGGAADSGPATGADGGEAYRDPFDPDFWTQQVQVTSPEQQQEARSSTATDGELSAEDEVALAMPQPRQNTDLPETASKPETNEKPEKATDKSEALAGVDKVEEVADAPADGAAERTSEADALRQEIAKQIDGVAGKLAEGLVVTPAEGGLLVTISDQAADPMFNIGSAVPRREMVLAMEKIGKILQERKGAILVRGHTDGRQFQSGENDNWRLSMARAHSAYYMLVRGGLKEDRVQQVSGYADRRLQVPEDPLAAANRRIEILLQADEG
ncbi:flagellar motor protein MotB [Pseudorhizobium halotolerans]|uniref:Flagellar motor protein MotB n=1 Tax=Pseudorhizobium halotolerans TaxID=1233081 RepID=A0ABN7JTX7_9HYPH|nr:MotB family protein [Pseudorhizobium halotolerans]CAD7041323.1 flagellar motor protein MotB [Pseudorhizobium halotolerans]